MYHDDLHLTPNQYVQYDQYKRDHGISTNNIFRDHVLQHYLANPGAVYWINSNELDKMKRNARLCKFS